VFYFSFISHVRAALQAAEPLSGFLWPAMRMQRRALYSAGRSTFFRTYVRKRARFENGCPAFGDSSPQRWAQKLPYILGWFTMRLPLKREFLQKTSKLQMLAYDSSKFGELWPTNGSALVVSFDLMSWSLPTRSHGGHITRVKQTFHEFGSGQHLKMRIRNLRFPSSLKRCGPKLNLQVI